MPVRFDSSLLAIAAEFTGKHTPWQGVEIAPLGSGVSVTACDRGAVALIAFDPKGVADESMVLLPGGDLLKAARGLKTAERDIYIDGATGVVTTYRKEHSTSVEVPVVRSSVPFPPVRKVLLAVLEAWGSTPELSTTAGRYDADILLKILKAAGNTPALVISGYDGGPLRIQREDCQMLILAMPQEAVPIPPLPDWAHTYAQVSSVETQETQAA